MVEIQPDSRAADAAAVDRPLALPRVALPDLTLHPGRDAILRRAPRIRRRRGPDAAPLAMPVDEQLEAGQQDRLRARARMRMGERVTRDLEQIEEVA
ncbi:MAG: hypothetical protein WB493_08995 [Anaeromyxobacteraceae bacterium]